MGDLSEHFSKIEFACRCGNCGNALVIDQDLVDGLETLRDLVGEPIIVIDGYRCPQRNAETKYAATHSQHMLGKAADVRVKQASWAFVYEKAEKVPVFFFGGIGVYPNDNFVHVDTRMGKARWARVAGEYVGIERAFS